MFKITYELCVKEDFPFFLFVSFVEIQTKA